MTNIAVLNSDAHRHVRVRPEPSALYGDNQRFVPLIVGEFSLAALHYPILLSKDADTGAFYSGAMLGFDVGENLFLTEGKGHEAYRPLNLQRGPFFAAGSDLAIDLDSPRIDAAEGQSLFGEAGEPTPYLRSIMTLMLDIHPGLERTKIFIRTLMDLKLVESVTINASFDDGTKREVVGLYTIDQSVLRGLPDPVVIDLFRRGYLQLIYLMIASLKQVPVLAQRKSRRILQGSDGLAGNFG